MSFDLDSYVDVAERIRLFYEKFPEGRLTRRGDPTLMEVGNKLFVMYTAEAWRTADDPHPCVGTAWEPFPGPTQFTRDSELMNAETAAWGRAIIAAGIGSKKIASREEVENRRGPEIPPAPKVLTKPQRDKVLDAVRDSGITDDEWDAYRNALGAATDLALTMEHAHTIRAWLDSLEPRSDIPSDVPAMPSTLAAASTANELQTGVGSSPGGDVPRSDPPVDDEFDDALAAAAESQLDLDEARAEAA